MNKRLVGGVTVLAALFAAPFAVLADGHEAEPNLSSVWVFAPKQGMGAEFEAAVKEHVAFREANGDSRAWQMYSVAVGDKIGIYQVRACCFDWADQDAYVAENADKGFGAHFNETVGPYVDHTHHYFDENDWENSAWPDDLDGYQFYGVTTWTWKEDADPAVSEIRKEMSQMAIESGWGDENYWLWHTRVGGKPILMIVSPYKNYADMAPPEKDFVEVLVEHSGKSAEEIGSMFQAFGSGFSSSEYTVWQHRPDLSLADD